MSKRGRAFLTKDLKVNSGELAAIGGRLMVVEGLALGGEGEALGQGGVREELSESGGEGGRIGGRDEEGGFAMGYDFGDAANVGSDDGNMGHHGFE